MPAMGVLSYFRYERASTTFVFLGLAFSAAYCVTGHFLCSTLITRPFAIKSLREFCLALFHTVVKLKQVCTYGRRLYVEIWNELHLSQVTVLKRNFASQRLAIGLIILFCPRTSVEMICGLNMSN
jgi:hypothetical protein